MHRAESFCWVRIDGVRSTVTLFHLAGLNLSKQHEISYVEVDDRDTGGELHYYRKRGPKNIGLQTDKRLGTYFMAECHIHDKPTMPC